MRSAANLGLCLFLAAMLAGCLPKGRSILTSGSDAEDVAWQPAPVRMRVYPASRFARGDGHVVLEARVELVDEMGDPIKVAGRFRFELRDTDRDSPIDQRLYSWNVPLLTLEQQRQHYDSVTRTYLFRLRMDEQLVPRKQMKLLVEYLPPTGTGLSAEYKLDGAP